MHSIVKSLMFLPLAILAVSLGCARKQEEGYRIVSYDGNTGQWVIVRTGTFDGKYLTKRLTVICDFYKWGDHEIVAGPQGCSLQVGRLMLPNPFPAMTKPGKEFLDIWEATPDTLFITEGEGPDRVTQGFTILKYELLSK